MPISSVENSYCWVSVGVGYFGLACQVSKGLFSSTHTHTHTAVWISLEKISWKAVCEFFGSFTVENSYWVVVDVGYFVLACQESKGIFSTRGLDLFREHTNKRYPSRGQEGETNTEIAQLNAIN